MFAAIASNSGNFIKLVSAKTCIPRFAQAARFGTAAQGSVIDAWNRSCYHEMDFTISEDSTVYEAVERFSAYDVGALVTTDKQGMDFSRSFVPCFLPSFDDRSMCFL
jgi:hypothetical protein